MSITAKIVGNELLLVAPIVNTPSGSGKSTLVATTNGNIQTDLQYDGKPVTVSINAYTPNSGKTPDANPNAANVVIEGKKILFRLPINPQKSTSGKSLVIASTRGNWPVGHKVDGKELVVGVNAYVSTK